MSRCRSSVSASAGLGWMLRPGMPLVQQAGEAMAKVLPLAHRGLEQRFLNVAWHIAPNGHRSLAQQQGKGLLFGHVAPPRFLRLIEAKVPFPRAFASSRLEGVITGPRATPRDRAGGGVQSGPRAHTRG